MKLSVAIPGRSLPTPLLQTPLGLALHDGKRSERVTNEQAKGDGLGYGLSVHHETVAFISLCLTSLCYKLRVKVIMGSFRAQALDSDTPKFHFLLYFLGGSPGTG